MQEFWNYFWFPKLNFIQFTGRHFINFMPLTQYAPYVYLNAALVIILTLFGFYFLLKTKKSIAVVILSILLLISLLYFLKIYPIGMALDPILAETENFAMAQVVGSRLILYFLPLIFIVISFGLYKLTANLTSKTFIIFVIFFIILSALPNVNRIQSGLGTTEYSVLLEKIKPYSTNQTAFFVSNFNSTLHAYYQRESLQVGFFSTLYASEYALYINPARSLGYGNFYIKGGFVASIFSTLQHLGSNRVIFIFTNYDIAQVYFLEFLLDYLPKSEHKWLIIPAKDAAAVIVEI